MKHSALLRFWLRLGLHFGVDGGFGINGPVFRRDHLGLYVYDARTD